MCDTFGWDDEDYEMREARRKFKSAMVQQFNILYGTDVDDLNSWKSLCGILNIVPVPATLEECRKVSLPFLFYILSRSFLYASIPHLGMSSDLIHWQRVRRIHVNLVDLVDAPRTGKPVMLFPNLKQLREYTISHEKYFPKEDAHAGGLLRFLLRDIVNVNAGATRK